MLQEIRGVSENTTAGVTKLYKAFLEGKVPLFWRSKFDNYYGCLLLMESSMPQVMLAGKVAVVVGYGEVGKGVCLFLASPSLLR